MADGNILRTFGRSGRLVRLATTVLVLAAAAGCAARRGTVPPGTLRPDQFLFDRGNEELKERHWLVAREFFRQVSETYTQSPLRPDAKLAIGDTFLGEGTPEAYVQAMSEFREFLAFYPTNPRADYAQYKLGMAYFRQMRSPQRDQTDTRNAIREFDTFVTRYPNSELLSEVKAKLREAQDNLSTWDLEVGRHYFRLGWQPGAIDRLTSILKQDPDYTRRDAVYFYLGESLMKAGRNAEALPYFERILSEFERSEHLEDARKRIAVLKAQIQAKSTS
jgi:outer membrane protein assembly factor BamD